MITEILRNMFRRKTRTLLTIFGITIGIFAFTVMGSMAEKISLLVSGGTKYYGDKVIISGSDSLFISAPLDIHKRPQIEKVDGVAAVSGTVFTSLTEKFDAVSFGPPASISGFEIGVAARYETFKITYSDGRALRDGEDGKVTIGSDLVKKLNAKVGGKVKVRGQNYEVVGIMNKTLTAPDNEVLMTLVGAQKIYYGELPEIVRAATGPEDVVNGFTVYVKPGVDPDKLAEKINKEVPNVKANGPKAFQDQIASATAIFNAILFGVALISLIVGGLSVINTMTMSISERTREIGIKKAVGARTRNILGEYLTEAGLIGLFGGLLGWGLGAITVLLINKATENSGNQIFLLSGRISFFAIGFSVILGVLAGFYPAYHAVKINIVKAIREE
ncbi:ABC transporter permease [Candidatus Saccharibacteria bacterium]|nr:ABC transporter permease [Candidatus Saccharibacteria bacterium]